MKLHIIKIEKPLKWDIHRSYEGDYLRSSNKFGTILIRHRISLENNVRSSVFSVYTDNNDSAWTAKYTLSEAISAAEEVKHKLILQYINKVVEIVESDD